MVDDQFNEVRKQLQMQLERTAQMQVQIDTHLKRTAEVQKQLDEIHRVVKQLAIAAG